MSFTSKRCPFHFHISFVTGFAKVSRAKFIYQRLPSRMPRQPSERTIIVIYPLANCLPIPIDTKMLQVQFFLQTTARKLRRYHQYLFDQHSLYFFFVLFKCPDSLNFQKSLINDHLILVSLLETFVCRSFLLFCFYQLVKSGRLKHFPSIHGKCCNTTIRPCKNPCLKCCTVL